MVKLKQLIQYVTDTFDCIVYDTYEESRDIYDVEVLYENCQPDIHTLYVLPSEADLITLKSTFHHFQKKGSCFLLVETVTDCSCLPFSCIRISHMPEPAILRASIREKLKFESRLETHINHLYHALYYGHGLTDVVNRAEEYLKLPISVLDASYSMIETSPLMKKMEYGIDRSNAGMILKGEEIESLRRLQIEDQIYEKNQAFCVQTPDHPDNNWIFCAIRIQNVMTGYVAVCLPCVREATAYEIRMTTALADICAIEMQKHDFFVTRTGLKYENFLVDLLEGRFTDVNMISSRIELLDRKFCKYFCLVVLKCTEPHDSNLFNKRQISTLRTVYPNCMSIVYKDSIILFLNQDMPILLNPDFTAPLEEFARRNHMKAGFSQPFVDILKINALYQQAQSCLRLGMSAYPDQTLFFGGEMISHFLFSKCSYQELEIGVHYHIQQLFDYDAEYHTEFIATLRAYLDNDRNMAQAAAALHIHRSTFFYRIKKIEELLDISITDSHLLFLYEISFQIWDYLSQ